MPVAFMRTQRSMAADRDRGTLAAIAVASLVIALSPSLACEPTAPRARPVMAPVPAASSTAAASSLPSPAHGPGCVLRPRPLPASTPASWGDVRPGVWLLGREGAGHDVFFPSSYNGPYHRATLAQDGSLRDESKLAPFDGLGEASYPALARLADGVLAAASTVYVARENADTYVALQRGGKWASPTAILPGSELDTDVVLAAGHGRFALAWSRGPYPSAPGLAFAVVEPDAAGNARVVGATVLDPDMKTEGKAIVATPEGWILFLTPSSALSAQSRGLFAIVLDRDGRETARKKVLSEPVLWPIATVRGREVGVAFRATRADEGDRPRGVVGFLKVDLQGQGLGGWVVADRHPDPVAGLRPYSLVAADDGGWWLADIASFHVSVMIARASEGRVVKLDAAGQLQKAAALNEESVGASSVRIVRHGDSVRGVLVEDRGTENLRAFDIACEAPPAESAVKDRCAPRTVAFAPNRHAPLQGLWDHAIEVEGDLVVGFRERERDAGYLRAGDDVHVARLRADGTTAWDVSLGRAYYPHVAYRAGTVAVLVKVEGGAPQELVLIDAVRGAVTSRRKLAADVGMHCILGTDRGWLVAEGPSYGAGRAGSEIRWLAPDGSPAGQHSFPEFNACDLRKDGGRYAVAFTHPGNISETNHLFLAQLDATGRAVGSPRRVQGVEFARDPRFRGNLLVFSGALSRELYTVRVEADLSTTSPATVVQTYGLLGYGFWGDSILWSTEEGIGRRGCLESLGRD